MIYVLFTSRPIKIDTHEPNSDIRCPDCGATCYVEREHGEPLETAKITWKFCPLERLAKSPERR